MPEPPQPDLAWFTDGIKLEWFRDSLWPAADICRVADLLKTGAGGRISIKAPKKGYRTVLICTFKRRAAENMACRGISSTLGLPLVTYRQAGEKLGVLLAAFARKARAEIRLRAREHHVDIEEKPPEKG